MTAIFTTADIEAALGDPLESYAHDCHSASITLVQSGLFKTARVARGSCRGVGGQHSWVVLGTDVYDPKVIVVDPTLWSYDDSVSGIWLGPTYTRPHIPHQSGLIWTAGKPPNCEPEDAIVLDTDSMTGAARRFLEMVGPLDARGWMRLFGSPLGGWPAGEILTRAYADERLRALIPIDAVGHVTDLNPGGLYLKADS